MEEIPKQTNLATNVETEAQIPTPTPISISREPSVAHSDVSYNLFVGYLPSKNFSAHRVKLRQIDRTRFTGTIKKNHFTDILCKQTLVVFDNKGCLKVDKDYAVLSVGMQIAPEKVIASKTQLRGLNLKFTVKPPVVEVEANPNDPQAQVSTEDTQSEPQQKRAPQPTVELEAKLRHDPEGVPQIIRFESSEEGDVASQVVQAFQPPFVWSISDEGVSTQTAEDSEPKLDDAKGIPVSAFLQMTIAKIREANQGDMSAIHTITLELDPNSENYGSSARLINMNIMMDLYRIYTLLKLFKRHSEKFPGEIMTEAQFRANERSLQRAVHCALGVLTPFMELVVLPAKICPEITNPQLKGLVQNFVIGYNGIKLLLGGCATDGFKYAWFSSALEMFDWHSIIMNILYGAPESFIDSLEKVITNPPPGSRTEGLLSMMMISEQETDPQMMSILAGIITDRANHFMIEHVKEDGGQNYKKVKGKAVCNFSACDVPHSCRFGADGESLVHMDWIGISVQYGESSNEESVPRYIRYFTSADMSEDTMKFSQIEMVGERLYLLNGESEDERMPGKAVYYSDIKPLYELLDKREKSADPLEGGSILPFFGQIPFARDSDDWNMQTVKGIYTKHGLFMTHTTETQLVMRPIPLAPDYQLTDKHDIELTAMLKWEHLFGFPMYSSSLYCPKIHTLFVSAQRHGTTGKFSDCGPIRRFGLVALSWNRKTGKLKKQAATSVPINEAVLACLPVTSSAIRVSHPHDFVRFVREKKRVFALISPAPEIYSCLLVYVYWRGEFVPVAGNYKDYPGLHVFPTESFLIWSINATTLEHGLFIGVHEGYNEKGFAEYDVLRIALRW